MKQRNPIPVEQDLCSTRDDDEQSVRQRLNGETGVIEWSELVRHFARGVVIKVEPSIDLLDAAAAVVLDNTAQIQCWLDSAEMARASDEDARDWTRRAPAFRCVVAAPWVLVQERVLDCTLH